MERFGEDLNKRKIEVEIRIEEIALHRAKILNKNISKEAIDIIKSDIEKHGEPLIRNMKKDGSIIIKSKSYNIYESEKKLVEKATIYAERDNRETILSTDIKLAMQDICPTYWPFC